jgi:ferredoxin
MDMDTVIFWFSGTGNSLVAARSLGEKLDDAELVPIPGYLSEPYAVKADRVGIVFPVYVWGPPNIVSRFVEKLDLQGDPYVFGFVTYGGFPGNTLGILKKKLSRRSIELACGFGAQMPGNYTPMYGAKPKETQEKQFAAAEAKIADTAEYIAGGEKGTVEKSFFLVNWLFSSFLYPLGIPKMLEADRHFRVLDSCTSCGICEKVCPADNIAMKEGKPVWQHHCEQCMACLQWCPEEAVQYKTVTEGRKRYRHPDVTVSDFMFGSSETEEEDRT